MLGIWGAMAKYFQGAEEVFSWIQGDQAIILREQGRKDLPWGPQCLIE